MYSAMRTRPDSAYAVSVLGRYLSNPRNEHWVAVKKVLRYLQKTKDHMLVYREVDDLQVICYADADLAGCTDDRKSTTGFIFTLAGGAISWKSYKQSLVASSTMEAEIVACYETGSHAKWLRNFIFGLKIVKSICRPLKLFFDNSSTVSFAKSTKNTGGATYIELKYFNLRGWVDNGDIEVVHIPTDKMLVDPLTKGLRPVDFNKHVLNMGLAASFDVLS